MYDFVNVDVLVDVLVVNYVNVLVFVGVMLFVLWCNVEFLYYEVYGIWILEFILICMVEVE